MQQYILALDQGTTSSRAVLLDRTGTVVHKAQRPFRQIYPKPGWVEHDPMEILSSEVAAIRDVLQSANIRPGQICAVGITNQRETTVVWEKDTGAPIYNAIVWQCRRTAAICEGLEADGLSNYIADTTGLIPDAYFSATKLKWILDAVPGARASAQRGELLFGTVDTWLIWNLTGGKAHVTDFSNASRTMLFNIDTLQWDELLCQKLDIPKGMLPLCCPSSHIYGAVAKIRGLELLEGVPIAGDAGDQQAALFGQTCFEAGQAKNTYGTGCFTLMNTGEKRMMADRGLLSVIAWGIGSKVCYALEGSVFNAGSVIQWLRDELQIIKTAHEADILAESVEGTQGVVFVPAFTGLGAPYWDMYARGTILGLTRGAGRAHIARAVLESIAYQVSDLFYTMREVSGIALKELRVDGGASVSDFLMQFQADMLGTRVDRPQNIETTAAGAGFLAGLACGFWPDLEALKACRESERIFLPQMEHSSREALYANWKRGVERSLEWAK